MTTEPPSSAGEPSSSGPEPAPTELPTSSPSVWAATTPRGSVAHVAAFILGSLACMILVTLAATVVLIAQVGLDGARITEATLSPQFLGFTSMVQILVLAGLAVGLAAILRGASAEPRPALSELLGLQGSGLAWYVAALVGGATVWTFPSWLAEQLARLVPWDSTVALVGEALKGPTIEVWPLIGAVAVTAPLAEELIFRGYLWSVWERGTHARWALVITTGLFALYHMDPVHVVALLPTAVFLGVLRAGSGSIGPAILAHFVNNAIGVASARLGGDAASLDEGLTLLPAIGGLLIASVAVGGAWWLTERDSR